MEKKIVLMSEDDLEKCRGKLAWLSDELTLNRFHQFLIKGGMTEVSENEFRNIFTGNTGFFSEIVWYNTASLLVHMFYELADEGIILKSIAFPEQLSRTFVWPTGERFNARSLSSIRSAGMSLYVEKVIDMLFKYLNIRRNNI